MGNILCLGFPHGRSEQGTDAMKIVPVLSNSIQMTERQGPALDEHRDVSVWKSCIEYKAAILWSLFISISSLMWGYDLLLSNALSSIPGFQQDYGHLENGVYVISWKWQILYNTMPHVGAVIGSVVVGHFVERYGRRNLLAGSCIISIGAIFLQIFSEDPGTLLVGKFIYGLSLGSFLTISSTYAAELVPSRLSFITTSSVQLFIGIGQLFASIILKIFGSGTYPISYKIPFIIQIIFPVILLCGIAFCPESPWYLLRHSDVRGCYDTLRRLGYPDPESTIEEMVATVEAEVGGRGLNGYLDCFKKENLRRTEIAVGAFVVSQLVGEFFVIGYSSYFFELAFYNSRNSIHLGGLVNASSPAFSLSIGVLALGLVGIVSFWFILNNTNLGRRGLMLNGTMALTVLLGLIGILDVIPTSSKAVIYGQCVCVTLYTLVYFLTVGTVSWVLFTEVGSSSLRSWTCGLAIGFQSLFGILMNIVVPLMINPDKANMSGKIGFVFAGTSILSLVWIYFRVPETSNLNTAELDILFREKVPTRKFKSYQFDIMIEA